MASSPNTSVTPSQTTTASKSSSSSGNTRTSGAALSTAVGRLSCRSPIDRATLRYSDLFLLSTPKPTPAADVARHTPLRSTTYPPAFSILLFSVALSGF